MVCRLPLLPSWIPFTILLAIYMSLVFGEIPGDRDFNNGEAADTGSNVTKNYTLTGIPQIDYVHDPNLPRELNGYNLSTYPFLNKVPTNNNYSCEGLKDGFYASVEYKCQLYHQCLFGNRYDFLCANYTAFDQRTFICHFVSEVDCPNSALHFHRNDALYIGPTTTTSSPARRPSRGRQRVAPLIKPDRARDNVERQDKTSVPLKNQERDYSPEPVKPADDDVDIQDYEPEDTDKRGYRKKNRRRRPGSRRRPQRRRPYRRRRPYYYDDEYYEDDDYDDYDDYQDDYDEERRNPKPKTKQKTRGKTVAPIKLDRQEIIQSSSSISSSSTSAPAVEQTSDSVFSSLDGGNATPVPLEELYTQSRPPPKIRPPVPKHAVSKYEIMQGRSTGGSSDSQISTSASQSPQQSLKTDNTEYIEYDYEPSSTSKTNRQLRTRTPFKTTQKPTTTTTTATTTTTKPTTQRTTEAPEYEYYEYEDDMPQEPVKQSPPSPTTTTTTTTTTTPKPQYVNRRLRSRKPEITQETIQSSVSTPIVVTHETSVSVNSKTSSGADRFLRRSKPSLRTYTSTSNQAPPETIATISSTTPTAPSPTTSSTTRPVEQQQQQQQQQQQLQQPNPSRFPSYEVSNSKPSETQQTIRPSRFWQRQQKIVSSTTTTLAPSSEYVEYYDDSVPSRYGQKSASTYTQQQQQQPKPVAQQYTPQQQQPKPVVAQYTPQQPNKPAVAQYTPQQIPKSVIMYQQPPQQQQQQQQQQQLQQQQQQLLIQRQQYSLPDSTEVPERMINYNSSPRYQMVSNIRPLDQSNFVTPYVTQQPNLRPTPEFISLLSEDESYYSVDPHRRFHNTPLRQYNSAAQETFPSYAPPPPNFNQYLKRIQQRHVPPQSYPWY